MKEIIIFLIEYMALNIHESF